MCEFCIKHGEGKKWYEVVQHFSKEMAAETHRQRYIGKFIPHIQQNAGSTLQKLKLVKQRFPAAYRFVRAIGTARMKKLHYGQVVPIEDAEVILDMVQSVTRIACVCRSVTTGANNARYCLLLGIDPHDTTFDFSDLQASLETITPERAKELLREFDREGLVHSIWTFKTPFIGAICNCDHDCLAYKIQADLDLMNIMFKAEYIASIDLGECTGCRACQKMCQFGAVQYSVVNSKCYINPLKCYGCGVCRNACQRSAITLTDKRQFKDNSIM